jgi:hypothetical protein
MKDYNYKRELKGISEQWHKIILPDDVFGKTNHNLSDIRIFGMQGRNDTIEAPYLLKADAGEVINREVEFKVLNTAKKNNGYYFTFEISTDELINQIKLDFQQQNFDWHIRLEGSQDQKDWFTVLEDYRILSIKNELTDFQATKLTFPDSKYRYFRVRVVSNTKPKLLKASISKQEVKEGTSRAYAIKKMEIHENKRTKQTELDLDFHLPVRISHLDINVSDTYDYYRPVTVKYLADSVNTEKGWKYMFRNLASGTLNSIEKNELKFKSTTLKKLKVIIDNHDNQALNIESIVAKGYVHELLARFSKKGKYYLVYGNERVGKASYDIERFSNNIPIAIKELELGKEKTIDKKVTAKEEPLFKNKKWLWAVMVLIIALLGWFTLKMIKQK